jgi:predicted RNase H-like nuclease (RuvC/YqgF family)
MMENYESDLQELGSFRTVADYSSDIQKYRLTSVFIPSLAPAYPSITDELKKDVAILKTSLEIRDDYIDKLRKARDSLISNLDLKELHTEHLKDRIKRYQQLFYKAKEKEQEKTQLNGNIN